MSDHRIYSTMLQGDVSCYLSVLAVNVSEAYADISLVMFSGVFDRANVSLQYRLSPSGEWLSDMAIEADNSILSSGSTMYGVQCSPWGWQNLARWNFKENRLTPGAYFEIRVLMLPVNSFFSYVSPYSLVETVLSSESRNMDAILEHKVVNRDSMGNYLCVSDTEFYVVDRQANRIMTAIGFNKPLHAQENLDGLHDSRYIVLDSGNNNIVEITSAGVPIKFFAGAGLLNNPSHFHYDALTRNLLVNGGSVPKVYELSWDDLSVGTILWSHGQAIPGSDDSHLNQPQGVAYDSSNRDVVVIADKGNGRVVMVNRVPPAETVDNVYNVSFEDGAVSVPLVDCYRVCLADGTLVITEGSGESQYFDEDPEQHPSLVRALSDGSAIDSKNKL